MKKPAGRDVAYFGSSRSCDGASMRQLIDECSYLMPTAENRKALNEEVGEKFDAASMKELLVKQFRDGDLRDILVKEYGAVPEVLVSGNTINVAIANFGEVKIILK